MGGLLWIPVEIAPPCLFRNHDGNGHHHAAQPDGNCAGRHPAL